MPSLCFHALELKPLKRGGPISWRSPATSLGNCQALGFSGAQDRRHLKRPPIDDAGGQVGKGTSIGCLKNPMFHLDVAETGDYLNPWFGSNSGQL